MSNILSVIGESSDISNASLQWLQYNPSESKAIKPISEARFASSNDSWFEEHPHSKPESKKNELVFLKRPLFFFFEIIDLIII
jgi:hypothetical protein